MKRGRKVVIAAAIIVLAGIGVAFAVSQNSTIIANLFGVGELKTSFTEEFTSPSNWTTCETVDKTFTITNDANTDVAVRVKLEEQWISAKGWELPLVSNASGRKLAVINFLEDSGWTLSPGGYYYYDVDLKKGETTKTLTTGVTFNCTADLDLDYEYAGATYHLKITGQTIQADQKTAWTYNADCGSDIIYDKVACRTKGLDTNMDYRYFENAIWSDHKGLVYTFSGKSDEYYPVYYFRGGKIDTNNDVIWGGKCWKIVRTTETGGVKMVYNGEPTNVEVDGVNVLQCLANGADSTITYNGVNTFAYNLESDSPADVGYMYGTRIVPNEAASMSEMIFSNNVSRNGNTYSLNMDSGKYIKGYFPTLYSRNSLRKYHYFCTDGSEVCDGTKIGYILDALPSSRIGYIPIGGYDDIDDVKNAMFTNTTDSNAKAVIESWFVEEGLDEYEDDLEDTVFCNDRRFGEGPLKSKDSKVSRSEHSASARLYGSGSADTPKPTLDCGSKNDSFTKNETNTTNGKLNHKVGLLTADELMIAGVRMWSSESPCFLYLCNGNYSWTISPYFFRVAYKPAGSSQLKFGPAEIVQWNGNAGSNQVNDMTYSWRNAIRPVVSLKAGTTYKSGTGASTDPYIVGD